MSRLIGNRELSWLDFNERVLSLARETSVPLLERIKFCAIFCSNLDEFYQVRVAALKGQVAAAVQTTSSDGLSPTRQLNEIANRVDHLVAEHENVLLNVLFPPLADHGIVVCRWADITHEEQIAMKQFFERQLFPVLTPLAVDPSHPFPYISNLAISLGVLVRDSSTGEQRFARVKIPTFLKRFHKMSEGRYVMIEDIVAAHVSDLFVGMDVVHVSAFRVTRNADLTLDDEDADDLLAAVEMELRRRRFGRAVRLEVDHHINPDVLDMLLEELDLERTDVSYHTAPLALSCLWELHGLDEPTLKDTPWHSVTAGRLAAADGNDQSMFSVLRQRDLLVHHPYESFSSSTEEFLEQAANDPRVQGIKITLYRTSGDSPIARSLIKAAELGKQVVALIELTARFDEAVNVTWAKELERAGVHVVYGVVGLKTHCKCVLVVRQEESGLRRYVHVGTGNYNSKTARIYEDIGLFTCDEKIGDDVSHLFNSLTGFDKDHDFKSLIVAPRFLRSKIVQLIENEISYGVDGHIVMKINGLADARVIELLYRASEAGVRIDLIVRGICCIRPSSDHEQNIHIRSVLGRYLEHSRMYHFAHGGQDNGPVYYIGSPDMMPRNLDKRVEVLIPVEHPKHRAWIEEVFATLLSDDVVAFEMNREGNWRRVGPAEYVPSNDAQYRIHQRDSESQLKLGVPEGTISL
ncbi:MAG: polyphosphate kinase 1 [Ilumatobacteraceae bacterium]|nr:polyphosphate kinase 1 [Ilumatobacteraceae bacterium]